MARPVVTATTERLYTDLEPVMRGDGESTSWAGLKFVESLARRLDDVEVLARDVGETPGWAVVLQSATAPVNYLEWLAQFVGVSWGSTPTEADRRARIAAREGQARGTKAAMESAIKSTLTEPKQVFITEKWGGDHYALRVVTFTAQTPSEPATRAAILRQKPAGLILTYDVVAAGSIDALVGTIDAQAGTIDNLGS